MSVTIIPTTIRDEVSGLAISIVEGEHLNRIHIEFLPGDPIVSNRDFFFKKSGELDGTGSAMGDCTNKMKLIDILKDNKHHHFVYFWNAVGIEIDGIRYQEILYIDGVSYTDPEEIHKVVRINNNLLGEGASIDFGWHTNLNSLQQAYLDTLRKLEEKDEVQSANVAQAN